MTGESLGGTRRWNRLTARKRLTIAITLIPVGTAVVMGAVVYLFMRFIPAYDLPGFPTAIRGTVTVGSSIMPTEVPQQSPGVHEISSAVNIRGETDVLSAVLWISIISAVVLGLIGLLIGHILARRMPERLDHTFQSHQRFTADASHELRTPLKRSWILQISTTRSSNSGPCASAKSSPRCSAMPFFCVNLPRTSCRMRFATTLRREVSP